MQTNVIIQATSQGGKKQTTTISYVNPAVSNAKLLEMARLINEFTTRIFVMATKETKGEVL